MQTVMGWDIGGAYCKAARLVLDGPRVIDCSAAQRPLAIWRELDRLPAVMGELATALGPAHDHGLTMTAELADVFQTRAEGVRQTLAAAKAALPRAKLYIWTAAGSFVPPAQVIADPLSAAAANWLATASRLAALDSAATLLVDIGSTTTDLVPLRGGRVVAVAADDPGRLAAGELIYTGALRTPVCAVAEAVPVHGQLLPLAAELFAVMADVYLLLGEIGPAEYTCHSPDGRSPNRESAAGRLARAVCADTDYLSPRAIHLIARAVAEAQMQKLTAGALKVLSRQTEDLCITGAGVGWFLARRLAGRLGLAYRDLPDINTGRERVATTEGIDHGQAAAAAAVAWLLGQELAIS